MDYVEMNIVARLPLTLMWMNCSRKWITGQMGRNSRSLYSDPAYTSDKNTPPVLGHCCVLFARLCKPRFSLRQAHRI